MEIFLIRLLQFVLAISLLVFLHEGGHMFFSKLFGIRVEKFFIFFDMSIGKWSGKLFSFKPKTSDTEYGVGWLPLGGYCKIAGMIDESFDKEQMAKPAQPWEFRSKPAWQRLLVMIGGVLVNFLLALFIYSMVLFAWGEQFVPTKDMTMGMKFNKEAKALGFADHDILLGTDLGTFKDFNIDLVRELSEATRVDIIRDGKHISLHLPRNLNLLDMIKQSPRFVAPFIPSEVALTEEGSPAQKAGIAKGDRIIALNGTRIETWNEFQDIMAGLNKKLEDAKTGSDSLALRTVSITYANAKDTVETRLVLTPEMKMGVGLTSLLSYYEPVKVEYGFFESFPAGTRYGINILKGYVNDMKYVFSTDGVKSLGGFGAIGSLFPPTWDWHMFWMMTAFLSIILAFMNLLPIPALDGGHVLFLLYEMITRRKPSENFMIWAEYIGIGILVLLMVVANLNDVLRFIGIMD